MFIEQFFQNCKQRYDTKMAPPDLVTKSKTNETTSVSSRAFNSQFNSIYSILRVADPQGTFHLIVFLWQRNSQPGRFYNPSLWLYPHWEESLINQKPRHKFCYSKKIKNKKVPGWKLKERKQTQGAKCVYNLEMKFVSIAPNGILKISDRMGNPRECEWKSNTSPPSDFFTWIYRYAYWQCPFSLTLRIPREYNSSIQENMSLCILNK